MMMNAAPITPDPPATAGFDREGPWPPAARAAGGHMSRRAFLHRAAASALAVGAAAGPAHAGEAGPQALAPAGRTGQPPRFFHDPDFEFTFLMALGRAYYAASDVGRLLALAGQTADGDAESAYQAFTRAGNDARALAEASARHGHRVSARQAYLWAAGYYHSATYFIDATADPSRFRPTWETAAFTAAP